MMKINTIYNADCFDLLPEIPANSVDLIFSDPPYEHSLRDVLPDWNDGLNWNQLAFELDRLLTLSGQIAMFCDWTTAITITSAFKPFFKFRFAWTWQKSCATIVNYRKQPAHETELIFVYSRNKAKLKDLVFNWEDIKTIGKPYKRSFDRKSSTRKALKPYITSNHGYRYPREILNFPSKPNMTKIERTPQLTQKPVALSQYVIRALSNPDDQVLDCFAGSGSVAVACHRLGRRFIGIERDPVYYKMARERLEKEMIQGDLFYKNETSLAWSNDPGQPGNIAVLAEHRL